MPKFQRKMVLSVLVVFCVFCGWSCLFPYTGDDWAWGSSIGMERLYNFFEGYNGRYLGNLLELAVTRSKLLAVLAKALSFTFVCLLCGRYSGNKGAVTFGVSFALFLIMPKSLLREAVVWTAGFSNYVPSALISAVYIYEISRIPEQKNGKWRTIPVFFVLGFVGALFIENIAIFHVLLGMAVVGYLWLTRREFPGLHLGFLAGAVVGAVTMFSNSAYRDIATGTDYYRQVSRTVEDTVKRIFQNGAEIMDYLIFENIWFCLVVSVLLLVLVLDCVKKQPTRAKILCALASLVANWALLAVVLFEHLCDNVLGFLPGVLMLPAYFVHSLRLYVALGYVLTVVLLIVLTVARERQFRVLLPLFCVPVSMAPLLLVQPLGPRCVFAGYLLMMVCTADLFDYLWTGVLKKTSSRRIACGVMSGVILFQLILYGTVFVPVHYWDSQRNAFAKFQSDRGSDTVYLCGLPNEEYLHTSSPIGENSNLIERYILFYGLREDVTLEMVSAQELAQMITAQMP